MTGHSLAGLAGLNALYLVAGAAFLWFVRGVADWIDAAYQPQEGRSRDQVQGVEPCEADEGMRCHEDTCTIEMSSSPRQTTSASGPYSVMSQP